MENKWDELKKRLTEYNNKLNVKIKACHSTWKREFQVRKYEIECVLATISSIEDADKNEGMIKSFFNPEIPM